MNRKQIILEYRTNRLIKGHRPGVIFLKQNKGNIYMEGTADFIISIGKEKIYFQRLSWLFKKLLPKKDFNININNIKSYNLRIINPVVKCLTLYTIDKNYLEIFYYIKSNDTYETEMNIEEIIKILSNNGIKELLI